MANGNGEGRIDVNTLTRDEKLNAILEALFDLSEEFEDMKEIQAETLEKINDMDKPGDGFGVERYDS